MHPRAQTSVRSCVLAHHCLILWIIWPICDKRGLSLRDLLKLRIVLIETHFVLSVILYGGLVRYEPIDLSEDLIANYLLRWLGQRLLAVRVEKHEGGCASALP